MRIAVIGDMHLISPNDPFGEMIENRKHFSNTLASFRKLAALIKDAKPDLMISLGDIVDWYTDESRDFGIDALNEVGVPWLVTPGNHDYETYRFSREKGEFELLMANENFEEAGAGWLDGKVVLDNQVIDGGDVSLVLLNSALSDVQDGAEQWLNEVLAQKDKNYVFTHTPVDIPEMRRRIITRQPGKDLVKYVQSGAPWVYEKCLKGRVRKIFSGHLHFSDELRMSGTTHHMLSLSIVSNGHAYHGQGTALIVDTATDTVKKITI